MRASSFLLVSFLLDTGFLAADLAAVGTAGRFNGPGALVWSFKPPRCGFTLIPKSKQLDKIIQSLSIRLSSMVASLQRGVVSSVVGVGGAPMMTSSDLALS